MKEILRKVENIFLVLTYLHLTNFTNTSLSKVIVTRTERNRNSNGDMEKLRKALRSVDEEDRRIRDVESALLSIDRETAYHEDRKRNSIARVLSTVDEHTKQALKSLVPPAEEKRPGQNSDLILPELAAGHPRDGKTVTVNTLSGQKRVFVPKGWVFCTILPRRCY